MTTTTPARPRRILRSGPAGRYGRMTATVLVATALAGSLSSCSRWRPPAPAPTVPTTAGPQPTTAPNPPGPQPTTPSTPPSTPAPAAPAEAWRAEMVAAVNAERAKAGLNPMVSCATLDRAAQGYAEQLSARGVLSHYGPDGSRFFEV